MPGGDAELASGLPLQDSVIDETNEALQEPTAERAEEVSGEEGDSVVPSAGSANHTQGTCKPCAFLHTKGCQSGKDCQFCHLCDVGEKKKRRKEKLRRAAVAREGLPQAGATEPQQPLILATTCPDPFQSQLPTQTPPPYSVGDAYDGYALAPNCLLPPPLVHPWLQHLELAHQMQAQQLAWAWAQTVAQQLAWAQELPGLAPVPLTPGGSPEKVSLPREDPGSPTAFDRLVSMVAAGDCQEASPCSMSPQPLEKHKLTEASTPQKLTRKAAGWGRGAKAEEGCAP